MHLVLKNSQSHKSASSQQEENKPFKEDDEDPKYQPGLLFADASIVSCEIVTTKYLPLPALATGAETKLGMRTET